MFIDLFQKDFLESFYLKNITFTDTQIDESKCGYKRSTIILLKLFFVGFFVCFFSVRALCVTLAMRWFSSYLSLEVKSVTLKYCVLKGDTAWRWISVFQGNLVEKRGYKSHGDICWTPDRMDAHGPRKFAAFCSLSGQYRFTGDLT